MNFTFWIGAVGLLLLFMSIFSVFFRRGPFTAFSFYLITGITCGPWLCNLVQLDLAEHALWAERITSVAIAASLFITGLKLRLPFRRHAWRIGGLLAFPAMLITIIMMCLCTHYLFGIGWISALAFSAMIAPTDPVLASLISVNHARDDDELRTTLSVEAGLNDGTALPFLGLALLLYHTDSSGFSAALLLDWAFIDVLWALASGLFIGFMLGRVVGMVATYLRKSHNDVTPNDLMALALIALSYAIAELLVSSGFLAAFAAGVGLRRAEKKIVEKGGHHSPGEDNTHSPAEQLINPHQRHDIEKNSLTKSIGLVVGDAISFGSTLERLFAAGIIIALGITLAEHWDLRGIYLGFLLFVIVRPAAVYIVTQGQGIPKLTRFLIGWFGIRGIGSINYATYAYVHGLNGTSGQEIMNIALTLVVTSVLLHGLSLAPLLRLRKK